MADCGAFRWIQTLNSSTSTVMDTSASAETSKRLKVAEERCNENSEDRISQLPESILYYILSFLPTKSAIATSVLSTRWRFSWASVHNLDLNDQHLYSTEKPFYRRKKAFIRFVDRVLLLNDVSSIQKVTLACWQCDVARLNEWFSKFVRRNVQQLILSIRFKDSYVYSHSLLTCESLKILKIDSTDISKHVLNNVSMNYPSSICSSLKVLHLIDTAISGEQSVQEISLSFPILKEFVLKNCRWNEIKSINISAPKLQVLTVTENWNRDRSLRDCEIKIYAESIILLKLDSNLFYKYYFHNLPTLVNASLNVALEGHLVNCVGTLLRQISNVKSLELSAELTNILHQPDIAVHLFPFSNLTHMNVLTMTGCDPVGGKSLVDLLSNMPSIESLRFPDGLDHFTFKGQGRMIGKTPDFFLSHLKFVEICVFSGKDNEVWFIKFLMKSVRLLNKLTIKFGRCDNVSGWSLEDRKKKVTEKLEMLARHPNPLIEFSIGDQ